MKIAQVAPLYESVPPRLYGGTERVVSYLTEELVQMGHEVTLYASGDSYTHARLRSMCQCALRLDDQTVDSVAHHVYLAEKIFQEASQYDMIHSHIDYMPYPLYRRLNVPHVTTLHGRLDIPDLVNLYREFDDIPVISISDYQRLPLSWINWQGTVHHGVPENLLEFREGPGSYLAFVGRICPEKRVDHAIEIARRAHMPLKIAAKVDKADVEYFNTVIRDLFDPPDVEYVGEITDADKSEFLGNAAALLFLIDWPEPFGLVMIESLACGTPVIARLQGSVPEVIDQGATGFVVRDLNEAVAAVENLSTISRRRCREVFEQRFTARRMATDYLRIYHRLQELKATTTKQAESL